MWLDNGTPLCAPQFPNIQDGGTGHPPLRPSREHRASRTREAPSVRARDPAPVPFGEPFTRSLQSQGGPCQAAVPSPYNLIVFPRLRSITRGRAKTRLLKGQRPRPAGGEGVPSCPPPRTCGTCRRVGRPWVKKGFCVSTARCGPPPPGCVVLGQQPDLSELEVHPLEKGAREAHCKLPPHLHLPDGESEAEVSSVLCCAPSHSVPTQPPQDPPRLPWPCLPSPRARATCLRIYTNALSNQCPHRPGSSTCHRAPCGPNPSALLCGAVPPTAEEGRQPIPPGVFGDLPLPGKGKT